MPSSTSTNYQFNKLMTFFLEGAPYVPPTSLWLALFTTVPGLAGTGGVEVSTSGTAYGRQQILQAESSWNGPSGTNQEWSNAADITYNVPTGNWGTVTGAGLYDAETGGNLLYTATLATSKTVNSGDGAPRVLAGQLKISRATC